MKQRVITSAAILLVTVPILALSRYLVYPIALAILSLLAVFEVLRVLRLHRRWAVCLPSYVIAAALPVTAYFMQGRPVPYLLALSSVFFLFLLYLFLLAVFERGSLKLSDAAQVFVFVIYIVASFACISLMRYMDHGVYYFALVFIAAWVCDACAYIVGSLFGKHKLIPAISPKKTVEGSVGGIFFATAAFVVYGLLLDVFTEVDPNYAVLAVSGVVLSVVSQLGDLVASLFKREHGVKDYGRVLPGHGGIMDRFDSVIAVSTVLMMICVIVPPFR